MMSRVPYRLPLYCICTRNIPKAHPQSLATSYQPLAIQHVVAPRSGVGWEAHVGWQGGYLLIFT
jgi:hypothetical protein